MTIKDEIIAEIQKGRAGNNQGLSMGLPKLESIIDGVCQETYTLIISNSGAGKTSYALYAYLYKQLSLKPLGKSFTNSFTNQNRKSGLNSFKTGLIR